MSQVPVVDTTGAAAMLDEAAMKDLADGLRGPLLRPGDDGYDAARTIWNAMIDKHPALIARCTGAADVIACVNFARAHNLVVAVRGGGHNVSGNAVCDGGLMIDLSLMKSIRVDPVRRRARAEPGVTWREFDRETQTFGLATTGGQISTAGIAGLTLGGGWGWLSRKYGLACDNLLSVDIVTADGKLLPVNASENEDLFWGIRGGGGNFGVVTSFQYQLHPVGTLLGGMVAYPFEKAREVLRSFRGVMDTAPDELAGFAGITSLPDGTPVVGTGICYCGPIEKGERLLRPLRELGTPLVGGLGPIPYTAMQQVGDGFFPPGVQDYWKASFLPSLSDEAIDVIVDYCATRPSPMCWGAVEYHLGGAVGRVPPSATAFNHRDAQYSFMSIGQCADPADARKCIDWARAFWEAMQRFSTGGVYVNYLGRESDEGVERIKAAYGIEKYRRLVALKNKHDPTNFFRLNQNIKPIATLAGA